MLRVRWLNRDSSWLTTKPMRANVGRRRREDVAGPACRRSRGTTTTIAGHNHHDLYLRPTALLGQGRTKAQGRTNRGPSGPRQCFPDSIFASVTAGADSTGAPSCRASTTQQRLRLFALDDDRSIDHRRQQNTFQQAEKRVHRQRHPVMRCHPTN